MRTMSSATQRTPTEHSNKETSNATTAQSATEYNYVLSSDMEKQVNRVRVAVQNAREAVVIASESDSDDKERDRATSHGRFAISAYNQLLEEAKEDKASIAKLLENDVEAMKEELYKCRWQRLWVGWRGWF